MVINIKIFHSCCSSFTCVGLVPFVQHSCCTLVARVSLVLHSCCSCCTRVARVWHLCYTDLVYFTTRVPDTSDNKSNTGATRVRHEQHECYTNDTSATQVKNFDFHNDTSETFFHTPLLAIQQMKEYKERNNALFLCQNAFEMCITKTELCNGKSYIKKSQIRLTQFRIVTQLGF